MIIEFCSVQHLWTHALSHGFLRVRQEFGPVIGEVEPLGLIAGCSAP